MSPREGVYYAGWMVGIIVVVLVCRAAGIHHLIGLVLGLVLGLGLGTLAERAYVSKFGGPRPGGGSQTSKPPKEQLLKPGEVACRNPNCNFVGPSREHMFCPKCGDRLV